MSLYPVKPLPEEKQNTSAQSANTQAAPAQTKHSGFLDSLNAYMDRVNKGGGYIESALPDSITKPVEAAKDAAYRTATFGLLDKGNAALKAAVPGQSLEDIEAGKKPLAGNTFSERYHNALNEKSQEIAQQNAEHPVATTVGNIAGVTVPMAAGEGLVTLGGRALESLPAVAKTISAVKGAATSPVGQAATNLVGGAVKAAVKGAGSVGENAAINAAEEAGQNKNPDVDATEAAARGAAAGATTSAPGLATAAGGPYAGLVANEASGFLPKPLAAAFRAITTGLGASAVSNDVNQQTPDQAQKAAAQNPTDYSDSSKETDDGTPSPDVPQIKIVDGKKYLVTPSGDNVPLN